MFSIVNFMAQITLLVSIQKAQAQTNIVKPFTFVPPASPAVVKSLKPSVTHNVPTSVKNVQIQAIQTGYGLYPHVSSVSHRTSALSAKKKKAGPKKSNKLQVKMLKYVEGTGDIGEIVMVTPAFFENKLKRTGSAVLVTDEEVALEALEKSTTENEKLNTAKDLKSKLDEFILSIKIKAGSDGHLFGSVGKKTILKEIKQEFPNDGLNSKQVKVISVKGQDGNDLGKHDIKMIGDYEALIALHKDINAKVKVIVTALD